MVHDTPRSLIQISHLRERRLGLPRAFTLILAKCVERAVNLSDERFLQKSIFRQH